jgi:hypothetical protein
VKAVRRGRGGVEPVKTTAQKVWASSTIFPLRFCILYLHAPPWLTQESESEKEKEKEKETEKEKEAEKEKEKEEEE